MAGKAKGYTMSAADRRIVVLNTGSSRLKFAVYPLEPDAAPLPSADIVAFGHRIVHAGPDFDRSILVGDATLARIKALPPRTLCRISTARAGNSDRS
jgi:acetate kinase